jgi:hypothetical protein
MTPSFKDMRQLIDSKHKGHGYMAAQEPEVRKLVKTLEEAVVDSKTNAKVSLI